MQTAAATNCCKRSKTAQRKHHRQIYAMSGSGLVWPLSTNINTTSILDDAMNATDNNTCHDIQVKGQPLPLSTTAAAVMRSLLTIYYIGSFLLGLFLNGSLILIITRNRKLRNITFSLALQIVIVDFAHALVIYPTSAVNAIIGHFAFTGLCPTLGLVITFLRIARSCLMAMLVIDRFCTVFSPFWYNRNRQRLVVINSLVAWIVAMIVSLIPFSGLLDCYTFRQYTWACHLGEGCSYQVICTAYRTLVTVMVSLGLVFVLVLYVALLIKAKKIRNKISLEVAMANESQDIREESRRTALRERRANTTFFILFLALIGSLSTPFLFVTFGNVALSVLNLSRSPSPPAYTILAILARAPYVSLIILDPIVIMRHPEVREVIEKIKAKVKGKLWRESKREQLSQQNNTTTITPSNIVD